MDRNEKLIKVNFYDIEDWKTHKISIYSFGENPTKQQEVHLKHALAEGKKVRYVFFLRFIFAGYFFNFFFFRELMRARTDITYPPIGVLMSDTIPTVTYVMKDGPISERGYDVTTPTKKFGDDRINFTSALPPPGMNME